MTGRPTPTHRKLLRARAFHAAEVDAFLAYGFGGDVRTDICSPDRPKRLRISAGEMPAAGS